MRPLVIYMTEDLRRRLRAAKIAAGRTYVEWILDAFDAHYVQLEQVYPPLERGNSPLAPRPRIPRRYTGKRCMIQLDIRAHDLRVLDDTVERLQIPSRNELLRTVLQLALATPEET